MKLSRQLSAQENKWIEDLRALIERQPKSIFLGLIPCEKIVVMKFFTGLHDGEYRMDIEGFVHTYVWVDQRWDIDDDDD